MMYSVCYFPNGDIPEGYEAIRQNEYYGDFFNRTGITIPGMIDSQPMLPWIGLDDSLPEGAVAMSITGISNSSWVQFTPANVKNIPENVRVALSKSTGNDGWVSGSLGLSEMALSVNSTPAKTKDAVAGGFAFQSLPVMVSKESKIAGLGSIQPKQVTSSVVSDADTITDIVAPVYLQGVQCEECSTATAAKILHHQIGESGDSPMPATFGVSLLYHKKPHDNFIGQWAIKVSDTKEEREFKMKLEALEKKIKELL